MIKRKMICMSINITKSDVRWSYLSLFLFNGINILLLPFILTYLSPAEVGLWYTFTAVSGMVVILDFGFMTTLSRNITFIWAGAKQITTSGFKESAEGDTKPNYQLFVKLFKTTRLIYLALGLLIITILLTIGSYYVYSVSKDELPLLTILISWVIYTIAVFLNMRYAYWNAILRGIGAIKQNQQLLVITKISQLVFTVIGVLLGYGLIAVAVAYLLSIIINRVVAHYTFYSYQNNKENIKHLVKEPINKTETIEILKKILPNTYKQGLISISNYINLRSTTLLSSAFLGLSITASLGLVLQIINLITVVANTLFNTFLPQFSSHRINREYKMLKQSFKKAILANYLIIIISFTIVLFAGNFMLSLINSNVELLSWPFTLTIMLYVFLYNNHSVFATFTATKNILPHYKAFIVSSLLVLVLQLSLMFTFEPTLWYLILPILLVQLTYNNWRWPYVVIKELRTY